MRKILLFIAAAIMAITSVQAERIDYSGPTDEGRLSTAIYIYGDGFNADERFTRYTIIHPHGEMVGYDF